MTTSDLPNGASVFLDTNVFVFHFSSHPQYGPAATALLE